MEKQSEKSNKVMRIDRGGEYTSTEFQDHCKDEGIWKQLTAGYSPKQNGAQKSHHCRDGKINDS